MGEFKPAPKAAPPAYMVSFCDMMTLILTFFILLVSMAKEQQAGLLASGVGSFIVAVKSHGMNGILSGQEEADVFEHVRRKFNVPSDVEEERLTEAMDASNLELIKSQMVDALQPHDELTYPAVVEFPADSAEIPASALPYLEMLAPSLHPKFGQTLLIEGHSNDAGTRYAGNERQLAAARAMAVRKYLIDQYGFAPDRIEARAWQVELPRDGQKNQSVDIRLVTPAPRSADK